MSETLHLAAAAIVLQLILTLPLWLPHGSKTWRGQHCHADGTASARKLTQSAAFKVIGWAVVFSTLKGTLTDWELGLFAAAGVGQKFLADWMTKRGEQKAKPNPTE